MSALGRLWEKLNRTTLYSAKNPENFNNKWDIKTTPLRMFSLFVMTILLLLFCGAYFLGSIFQEKNSSAKISNSDIQRMEKLESELAIQEQYINDIKIVLSGGLVGNIEKDTLVNRNSLNLDTMDNAISNEEKKLANEVSKDLLEIGSASDNALVYFTTPVKGALSQKFAVDHVGVDVVCDANTPFKSCLDGTVIYTGYSVNDGNITIVKHSNNFISVYKHAKTIFKKVGDKIDIGDPLGIVGNSGTSSTGPHLHFELWHDQKSVNPEEFMSF